MDGITTINRDMFYCILASNFRLKKETSLPTINHKISEKGTLTNFFLLGLMSFFLRISIIKCDFFYKNKLYKNTQAEICPKIKNKLRTIATL